MMMKRVFFVFLAFILPSNLLHIYASPTSSLWRIPNVKLIHRSNGRASITTVTNNNLHVSSSAQSAALYESDFDLDDDGYESVHDSSSFEDESILQQTAASFRGGAATAAIASKQNNKIGTTGWLTHKQPPSKKKQSQRKQLQSQIQQLNALQRQKIRQFRKNFRQKQRQFQYSLYNLNSRLNGGDFPPPPYSLWKMEPDGQIGKNTLTGNIFLLNIAVFGMQTLYPALTGWGAKRSDLLLEGRQLHRLITPIFLHGGIGHLMANSYSLKSMGMNIERSFGRSRFVATYLLSGIMGNVVSAIQSPNPAVGASGAIFGLVGAYYTFLSRNQDLFGYSGQRQKSALIETIGFNLLLGMTNPMIDNWGHIGGFIGGVGCAYLFGPKLYVARVPLGEDTLDAGGFGVGKVVIDRPMVAFRMPEVVEEGMIWVGDGVKDLGRRVKLTTRGLLNGGGDQQLFVGNEVFSLGGGSNENEEVYRLVKKSKDGSGTVPLEGNVNVTPIDGLKQNVSELDPTTAKRLRQARRSTPRPGMSLRPRYGHLYR